MRALLHLIASIFLLGILNQHVFAETHNKALSPHYDSNYANDRAEIEDLYSRYMFAFDWQDAQTYALTFTEDGVLDFAGGVITGRKAIAHEISEFGKRLQKKADGLAPQRPPRVAHMIDNLVLTINGDTATGRAYWWEFNNDMRDRRPYLGAYGHYEDELKKVNGRWLFSKRKIFNEQRAEFASDGKNPAW